MAFDGIVIVNLVKEFSDALYRRQDRKDHADRAR